MGDPLVFVGSTMPSAANARHAVRCRRKTKAQANRASRSAQHRVSVDKGLAHVRRGVQDPSLDRAGLRVHVADAKFAREPAVERNLVAIIRAGNLEDADLVATAGAATAAARVEAFGATTDLPPGVAID